MFGHEWIEIPKTEGNKKLRGQTDGNQYIENTPSIKQDTVKIIFNSRQSGKTEKFRSEIAKDITDKVEIIDQKLIGG